MESRERVEKVIVQFSLDRQDHIIIYFIYE